MIVRSNRSTVSTMKALLSRASWTLVGVMAATGAWAGSSERLGTGGATELLIPVGARGSALGAGYAAQVSGAEAAFWNPAGLAGIESTEALFTHTQYFADMKLNYAAIATPAKALGVIGFSAKVLSVGDVIVTTEEAPDGTGEVFSPTFAVIGLSWAKAFTDRVQFGATMDYVNEHIQQMNANGLAFGFGVQYQTMLEGLSFAMIMKNFGASMGFDGDNLDVSVQPPDAEPGAANRIVSYSTSRFELPSYFALSASYEAWSRDQQSLRILGAFQNNNFQGDTFSGSAEWTFRDAYALRGSWFGRYESTTDPVTGDTASDFGGGDDLYKGYAFGGGAMFGAGEAKLGVDVAWRPVREPFEDVVEVGLRVQF